LRREESEREAVGLREHSKKLSVSPPLWKGDNIPNMGRQWDRESTLEE